VMTVIKGTFLTGGLIITTMKTQINSITSSINRISKVAFQVLLALKALLAAGTLNISCNCLRRHGQIR